MTAPINSNSSSTLPEELMSNLRPLLERNRAFAATGAHAGLAIMPRQPGQVLTFGHGLRARVLIGGRAAG